MAVPEQVDKVYVRRRAGAEWFFNNRSLDLQMLIESIGEDYQVKISVEDARQLFAKYISETVSINRTELEQEFMGAMRELGIENPEFVGRLKSISIEKLSSSDL